MAKLSAETRFSLVSQQQPDEALTRLNQMFCSGILEDRFVTLVMAVLNPATNEVTVVNAGHMPPMLRRASGEVEEVGSEIVGLPLGVLDNFHYYQDTVKLGPGEMVALYTDGINEAMNSAGKQYTIDRIQKRVCQTAENAVVLGDNIINDVRQFIGDRLQGDDMCLVCFSRNWPNADEQHPGATAIMK
jgi:serine phosphatase RsbU (regulator of sigma subunit)